MSDVSGAQATEPDLSPASFGELDEGEVRSTPADDTASASSETASQEETVSQEAGEQGGDDPYAAPPEFWSAERKAVWERIADPEARKAIHEQEKERITATNKKIEEAAFERKTHAEKAQQLEQERDQLANWWKETGPQLANAFKSKWADVDWNKLSAENPAEWARLRQAYDNDTTLIRQAAERHQHELGEANKRAERALGESKRVEHDKLAKAFPDHFSGEKAQKTYDEIRDYLMEQGVPAERITQTYESFVIGTALKAMLYDKAQKAAAEAKNKQQPSTTATQTPRRIAPGASNRGGQPSQGEAYRQASERLNNGEKLSDKDVALLFA